MIALVAAIVLLQQGASPPAAIRVRDGDRVSSIPVVATRLGAMVRTDDLLAPLGAVLMRDTPERFRLTVGGAQLEVSAGLAFVKVKGRTEPLAAAPTLLQGQLYLPLSFITELVPRVAAGFQYDARLLELRRVAPTMAARPGGANDAARAPEAPAERARPASPPPTREPTPNRKAVVVIDAGHGGRDRGMRGPMGGAPKLYEADITLAIAKRLRTELVRRGVEVVMTRTTDTLIALGDRGRIANRAAADLFLSIHVNAANPRWRRPAAARGFETYFLSEAKTDDERRVADLENEAAKYEVESDAPGGDPLSFILNDMKQNEYLRESSALAATVQAQLRRVHPGTDRGVKQAGFVVLVGAFMPAVLIETGFGTNPAEARYLAGGAGQQALAGAIADATMAYLSEYGERRAAGAPQ